MRGVQPAIYTFDVIPGHKLIKYLLTTQKKNGSHVYNMGCEIERANKLDKHQDYPNRTIVILV